MALPMDYAASAYVHPHDLVFQQMLRSAHLPTTAYFRADLISGPMSATRLKLERRPTALTVVSRPTELCESDSDEGYDADRDNGPRKLLKVSCDFFLEIAPSTTKKSRCNACRLEIRPSAYRLRSIDTSECYHVACFESHYNMEQGFGRIYASPLHPGSSSRVNQARLDDGAREIVKAWKIQRRQEGLTEASGPDTGIPTGIPDSPCISNRGGRAGEKRASAEVEDDAERKRAKFNRRNTTPLLSQPVGMTAIEPPLTGNFLRMRSSSTASSAGPARSRADSVGATYDEFGTLPVKLSDALKRLDGLPQRFSGF